MEASEATTDLNTQDQQSGANLRIVALMFFVSGFPALLYQVVWQRSLFEIFGVNIESVTVVVAAFMLGLGIGSLVGGWISKKPLKLLWTFGAIEALIALYGLASLHIFHAVGGIASADSIALIGIMSFLLVLVPTILMGATLPILTAWLVRRSRNVGRSVGLLYFVNTLGSAAACFAAVFFVMRLFHQDGTVYFAAIINVIAAAIAFQVGRNEKPQELIDDGSGAATVLEARLKFKTALFLAFATGFVALSYEIIWFRVYNFATGGLSHVFGALLGCYLLGIAVGSLLSRRYCGEESVSLRPLAIVVIVANFAAFMLVPVLAELVTPTPAVEAIGRFLDYTSFGKIFEFPSEWEGELAVWWLILLVAPAAALLGAALPMIAHFGIAPDDRAGSRLSWLYLANIAGSSSGSLVTGFVLFDLMPLSQVCAVIAVIGLALGMAIAIGSRLSKQTKLSLAGTSLALIVVVVAFDGMLFDRAWERLFWAEKYEDGDEFANVIENRSGVINVTKSGGVYGGGMYDGVFSTSLMDDKNMIVRAYAIGAFHPKPKNILMIGLASGSWAQAVVNHPDCESLTVVEINPGYTELIGKNDATKSLLTNPKVKIVIDDGRRWMRNNEGQFDAIIANTTWHFRSHASALLSVEFLELVKSHLTERGVYLYNTTSSARVQRTGMETFPHGVRILNNLMVSKSPIEVDIEHFMEELKVWRIDGELVMDRNHPDYQQRMDEIAAMLASYAKPDEKFYGLETRESILKRTEGFALVTDNNMGTEWALKNWQED